MSSVDATETYKPMQIAVLMTCFNRRALTLASLQSLSAQEPAPATAVTGFLVDDRSRAKRRIRRIPLVQRRHETAWRCPAAVGGVRA